MTENPLPNNTVAPEKKLSKFPRWLMVVIPVALIGLCCVAAFVIVPMVLKVNVSGGGYSIDSVTLSTGLDNGQPVGVQDIFMPSDTIHCTVKTTGIKDGIIGMRWYLGDKKLYEVAGKTQDNVISTYIRSNKNAILPEGKYRVEIYMASEALETVYFEVKIYHPTVIPSISIPEGHKSIETPWYPEVPFAFDEAWNIDGITWNINEAKVIVMNETQEYFVEVVVDSDMKDLGSISEVEAKARTTDLAAYAVRSGYIEKAKGLEIDGQHYDLDQFMFVTLINPTSQQVYRIKFTMDELKLINASQHGVQRTAGIRRDLWAFSSLRVYTRPKLLSTLAPRPPLTQTVSPLVHVQESRSDYICFRIGIQSAYD